MELAVLQKDMMEAMKAKDKERKESISVLYSAAKKMGIDNGCRDNVPEEMVNEAIMKEIKAVKEQIATCPKERTQLLEEFENRLKVFEEYAPKMMSKEEIMAFLNEGFSDVIATKNKGSIMKEIMPKLKGKADGKVINEVVMELCK